MKHALQITIAFLALFLAPAAVYAAGDVNWQHPEIKHSGGIVAPSDSVNWPSSDKTYKAIFDVTKKSVDKSKVNPGLFHVARTVNVFAAADVEKDHRKFVAIVSGPAAYSVLDDAAYKKRFGQKNPNTPLLKAMAESGVTLHVCAQSVAALGLDPDSLNKHVKVALSALSDLIIYGDRGYALVRQ